MGGISGISGSSGGYSASFPPSEGEIQTLIQTALSTALSALHNPSSTSLLMQTEVAITNMRNLIELASPSISPNLQQILACVGNNFDVGDLADVVSISVEGVGNMTEALQNLCLDLALFQKMSQNSSNWGTPPQSANLNIQTNITSLYLYLNYSWEGAEVAHDVSGTWPTAVSFLNALQQSLTTATPPMPYGLSALLSIVVNAINSAPTTISATDVMQIKENVAEMIMQYTETLYPP